MDAWKKVKRSGAYYREKKKSNDAFMKRALAIRDELRENRVFVRTVHLPSTSIINCQQQIYIQNNLQYSLPPTENPPVQQSEKLSTTDGALSDIGGDASGSISNKNNKHNDFAYINAHDADADDNDDDDEITKNFNLRAELKKWAVQHSIKQMALKSLLRIINERFGKRNSILPDDPRTLLQTPQTVSIVPLNDGEYWHNGLENCLKKIFSKLDEPITISLTMNIDGLPISDSSQVQFWPILFNIAEMARVPAMVIGIFCGKAKPSGIDSFLTPFVDEMHEIMTNGLYINSHKITVRIRCFVCDSPARAFVKGVASFNGQHGCLKCTTIGEYSYESNTNTFPRTDCARRTDEKFRQKLYGGHHKMDSPLLKLNIDMVEQFPVGDSLHLLHLGVMKRLLFGWRDGTFRNSHTKWRAKTTFDVSDYLSDCKLPTEFQRVVRALDCLAHWKGTEYRVFLHYIGIIVLKDHLEHTVYEHFLLLFCAVTICCSKQRFHLLPLARRLLLQYIEIFKEIYGDQYVTSNVHNLSHLVDEVERFGELESFSAYPFENMLGKIKRIIRSGNRPLAQIAKRIGEGIGFNPADIDWQRNKKYALLSSSSSQSQKIVLTKRNDGKNIPEQLKLTAGDEMSFYSKVEFDQYSFSTNLVNCWFLTNENEIARVTNIMYRSRNDVQLCCISTQEKEDFFSIPIKSSYLDIYCTHRDAHLDTSNSKTKLINLSKIKCKLVRLKYRENNVFLPLLHTHDYANVE